MKVYRITTTKWSTTLQPSGFPGRWNSKGVFMLYTSSSIALASLENLVHRSGEGLNQNFKTIEIHIPAKLKVAEVKMDQLPMKWFEYEHYSITQKIGDDWINGLTSPVLKIPSAIIKLEHNYLINPRHKDFSQITINQIEDFEFDPRLIRD